MDVYVNPIDGRYFHKKDCPMINPPEKHPPYVAVPPEGQRVFRVCGIGHGERILYSRGRNYRPCPKCFKGQDATQDLAIRCPDCDGINITSCPGGTCLKPSQWAKDNIKYICVDCLTEFGDLPQKEG